MLRLGASTLHESCDASNALPASLRPVWPGARLAGPAFPVLAAPGDNLALHLAVLAASAGDVLVVDAHDAVHGHWGEVMTVAAQQRGVAGLVIAGGVRDVDRLRELGFPVFSSSVSVRGAAKRWEGLLGETVRLGEVEVSRGDLVVADADGVVAIPADMVEAVVARARRRARDEEQMMRALREGATTVELLGLDERARR